MSGWERKEEENGGRVMCVERQERDLEGQGNEWKSEAARSWGWGEYLGSPRDMRCEKLPGLNMGELTQNEQQ